MAVAKSHYATKVSINSDFRAKGTSGFMRLIFLPGMLFTLENFNVLQRLCSAFLL